VAQQENAPNKPVHLMYLVGVIVLFYVLQWSVDWIWGYFGNVPSETYVSLAAAFIAITAGIVMYRSDKYYFLANEVASELKKVTWPTGKEVRTATVVVIVMAIISAVILGLFDFVWSNLTELVYG
jgi:preprotein translocase subunit SecE